MGSISTSDKQTPDNTDSQKISWPNRYAVQPRGFWQAADQVRILHRLAGRSLAEIVDHAHRDHQVALWIGRIADEREVRTAAHYTKQMRFHIASTHPGH